MIAPSAVGNERVSFRRPRAPFSPLVRRPRITCDGRLPAAAALWRLYTGAT